MRSVRCDACGLKALVAASQCPHCGHLFELRDSFGELLPLAHCGSCDSYYPLARGECRWCGTPPERSRFGPTAWKGVGVLAFAGMAWGAWVAHRTTPKAPLPAVQADSVVTEVARVPDTAGIVLAAGPDSTDVAAIAVDSSAEATSEESGGRVAEPGPDPAPGVAVGPRAVARAPAPAVRAPRARTRWVPTTVRSWVTVRAGATRSARLVAALGPGTRVQLGESRDEWVRLRTRGVSGWVERRSVTPRPGGGH